MSDQGDLAETISPDLTLNKEKPGERTTHLLGNHRKKAGRDRPPRPAPSVTSMPSPRGPIATHTSAAHEAPSHG